MADPKVVVDIAKHSARGSIDSVVGGLSMCEYVLTRAVGDVTVATNVSLDPEMKRLQEYLQSQLHNVRTIRENLQKSVRAPKVV